MEAGFDRALASAARSLVVEPMPSDLLAAPRPARAGSWLRSSAPLAAAVALIVLAIGSAIGAPRPSEPDLVSAFQTGDRLSQAFRGAGFDCRAGEPAAAGQARMEALICTDTTPWQILTVVASEDAAGLVGEIHIASDRLGSSTVAADHDRATRLIATVGLPFADPAEATAARAWLTEALTLDPGRPVRTSIGVVPVVLERGVGGDSIVLGDLGAAPGVTPTR